MLRILLQPRFFVSRRATLDQSHRSFGGLSLLALLATLLLAADALAQDRTVGEPMIGSRQFMGAAKRDGAVVRSGPTTGHLAVMSLARDQEVVVVGAEGEFLRILPPEGAFCLVARRSVEADSATRTGRITASASVRAGSRINGMPGETTATLVVGEQVSIVGEDSTYYHVTPPKNVFFYVHLSDLKRTREVKVTETAAGWSVAELDEQSQAVDRQQPYGPVEPPAAQGNSEADGQAPADQIAQNTEPMPQVVIPTTRPAVIVEFTEIDARYSESAKLPLEEQPLEELKQQYEALLAKAKADPAMEAVVPAIETRIETIALRQQALQDLLAMQAMREQMAKRQESLEAEQQELAERAQGAKVTMYSAVGQLRPSTLQVGGGALFRLCDPANGRTMIYLRADADVAEEIARNLERFVGVNGETMHDKDLDLKFIKVSGIASVDQAQVFKSVAAELIPPSLVQNAAAGD